MTMGENEVFSDETDSEEEQSPILIAKNAGANRRSPAGAAIQDRKRKQRRVLLSHAKKTRCLGGILTSSLFLTGLHLSEHYS